LDLAKIEAGRLEFYAEPVSTRTLVVETIDDLRALSDAKHIRIDFAVDPGIDTLYTDPARFKQILYNYLSNAIKFTPDSGHIEVTASPEGTESVCLEVSDNGIGIDAAELDRLFQHFEQLDTGPAKKFGGTGLGLALVKKLAALQGGRVGCTSEPGAGSRFFAVLPRDFSTKDREQ